MEIKQLEEEEEEDEDTKENLEQKFNNLEQYWDTLKQSNPRTQQSRCSTTDSHYSNIHNNTLYFLSISPRSLMSSLQHIDMPDAEMIRRENRENRAAAIKSGKFKELLRQRRLFDELMEEIESEVGFEEREETCSTGWSTVVQEITVSSSSSSASACLAGENIVRENMMMKKRESNARGIGYGGRWIAAMVLLLSVVFSIAIVSVKSFGGHYCDQNKVILFPT